MANDIKNESFCLPPRGLGEVEDQSDSAACVRYGLSKAIANALFVSEKIDIEQSHISVCLVQGLKQFTPLHSVSPMSFNGIKLYLQDKGNKNPKHLKKNKAWWKVMSSALNIIPREFI